MLGQILSVSIWVMIQHGIAFGGWFIFFIAMEHLGERPLAITNVVRSISSFLFMFVNAFASTNSSLVSNLIGAGESDRVLPLCRRMIGLCYAFVLPIGILIAMFPSTVLRIYTDNPDLIASSISSLWVMLSSYLFAVPGFIISLAYRGQAIPAVRWKSIWLAYSCTYYIYCMSPYGCVRTWRFAGLRSMYIIS